MVTTQFPKEANFVQQNLILPQIRKKSKAPQSSTVSNHMILFQVKNSCQTRK